MQAVVVTKPGTYGVSDVPRPHAGPGEVVVEVRACGLCGTDVHIARGEFPPSPYPLIPGHEFAGVVVEQGPGVDTPQVGSRVAVDPTLACGQCAACREGHPNLCARWGAIGDTVNGALAEQVAVPARLCYGIPDRMSWGEAALIEPLSCVLWAIHRVGPVIGARALVSGGGTMGLLLAQMLNRAGVSQITVLEPNASRQAVAREVGVMDVLAPDDQDALAARQADGFDLVADATGIPAVIQGGLGRVRRGGTFLVFGVAPQAAETVFRPFDVYNRDMTIVGSMAVNFTYGAAVRMASTLVLKPLLAPVSPLSDYVRHIEAFGQGERPKQQLAPTTD